MSVAHRSVSMKMQVGQMRQMHGARQKCDRTQQKSHQKTDEVDIRPSHCERLLSADGCKTCNSRSASPGFSKMAPSSTTHMRESAWRATVSSACARSGSLRKRSAPLINHKSSLSSTTPRSE